MNDADDVVEIADSVFSLGKQKLYGAAGLLSGVFGFVADVLQPIAPFALYLFIGFGILSFFTLAFYLGILQDSIDEIKENTEELKSTAQLNLIESRKLKDNTERTANTVEKINSAIESINRNGLRKNPNSAEDFYHNAKICELNGDYSNARKAYKAYIGYKTNKLEPHLRLIDFLRANEGRAGAQEEYNLITRGNDSLVVKYTKLLLSPLSSRKAVLAAFQNEYPEFAPTYYHLSREFSVEKLGKQQLSDKRQEYRWLKKFTKLNDAGVVTSYFVDKERLLEWQKDVAARLIIAEKSKEFWDNPITLLGWEAMNEPNLNDNPSVIIGASMYKPTGLVGTLDVIEPHLEIQIRLKGQDGFKSLGKLSSVDALTGKKKAANRIILAPEELIAQDIEVRYQNIEGEWSDIYTISLEERYFKASVSKANGTILVNPSMLSLLKNNQQKWVSFRFFDSSLLLYFTNLVKCRGVIKEVRFGLNSDILDQTFEMELFNGLGAAPMRLNNKEGFHQIHKEIPLDTKFINIQLIFKDGSKSALVKIINH